MASQYRDYYRNRVDGRRRSDPQYSEHRDNVESYRGPHLDKRRRYEPVADQSKFSKFWHGKQVRYTSGNGETTTVTTGVKHHIGAFLANLGSHLERAVMKYQGGGLSEEGGAAAGGAAPVMSAGTGGFSDSASAAGPVAGVSQPISKRLRKKLYGNDTGTPVVAEANVRPPKSGKSKLHAGRRKTKLLEDLTGNNVNTRQNAFQDTDKGVNDSKPAGRGNKWVANRKGLATGSGRGKGDGTGGELAAYTPNQGANESVRLSPLRRKIYEYTHNGGAGDAVSSEFDSGVDRVGQGADAKRLAAANPMRPKGPMDAVPQSTFVGVAPQKNTVPSTTQVSPAGAGT